MNPGAPAEFSIAHDRWLFTLWAETACLLNRSAPVVISSKATSGNVLWSPRNNGPLSDFLVPFSTEVDFL